MGKSSFFLERLVIKKSGKDVYNEKFHRGINVIRGDHSVGKTTVLEMIFYALGGEIKENQWLYPADRCDEVYCQISINGNTFTFKRNIDKKSVPPILIRSGEYEIPSESYEEWKTYGPRRSDATNKMSFSQQIFELLGWNVHKSDDYANLTMHQILRFLYVDQETSSTRLLRSEDNPRADSEGIRTAIFEFLLGLDNLDTHRLRQQLLIVEKEFEKISSDLAAMYKVLGADSTLTLEVLENNISTNVRKIIELRDAPIEIAEDSDLARERATQYRKVEGKVKLFNKQLSHYKKELLSVEGEIVDCELYENSLNYRKKSLLESQATYDAIGCVNYDFCPSCLQLIEEKEEGVCHLCHSSLEDVEHNNNYMEILTELDFQIKSNKKVLEDYQEQKIGLISAIKIAESDLSEAQSEQESIAKMIDLSSQVAIDNSKKIGYLEAENDNMRKMIEIIKELDANKGRKAELNSLISEIKDDLLAARASNKKRREEVYSGICQNIVSILKKDRRENGEPYEEVFDKATVSDVEIDFGKDRTLIDERVKFSGSSNYIKKNAFFLSALTQSLDDPGYRLPRFLMLDAIENGGMKPFRSHNFQKILVDSFIGRDDFQIIFCTSMVLDDLDNETFGVGPFYEGNVLNVN